MYNTMFSRISIRTRISLAFGLLVALLVVVAAFGQFGTRSGKNALHQTYAVQLASAVALGDMKYNLAIAGVSMDRALLHPESTEVKTLVSKALGYLDTSKKAYSRYLALPKGATEQRLTDAVSSSFESLVSGGIEPTFRALEAGDAATADRVTMTVMPNLSLA